MFYNLKTQPSTVLGAKRMKQLKRLEIMAFDL